jgi:hypothetical protein
MQEVNVSRTRTSAAGVPDIAGLEASPARSTYLETQALADRFHTLTDRKLLGQLTPAETEELVEVRSKLRESTAREGPRADAAESLRNDRRQLLDAIEQVKETLQVIQRQTKKSS